MQYYLKKSKKSKLVRISVHPSGKVTVTVPARVDMEEVKQFVLSKKGWIQKKIEHFEKNPKVALEDVSYEEYKRCRPFAESLVLERLHHYNQFYSFSWKKVSIKDTKTRWGSCSKNGNLNFSYKILLLSPLLQDYIVVHELCHLGEFNHSARFWSLIEKSIPEYKKLRNELKGLML